jgi:Zn-dependent M28 family amino/carboxypeptidase
MTQWLTERADTVVADSFVHVASSGDTLRLVNVMARVNPAAERRLLLLAHWDTRPRADQSVDEDDRILPVPGANDGASGTAILLELADMMASQRPTIGVDLLFVDGEDYGPGSDDMYLGSTRFASSAQPGSVVYAILLDMVGDMDPSFPAEAYSSEYAPQIVQRVWGVARDLGYGHYFPLRVGSRVTDDHIALNEAGIPTVDLIDFDYGDRNSFWHTPDDVPENVSPTTLGMVGEVIAELVYLGG